MRNIMIFFYQNNKGGSLTGGQAGPGGSALRGGKGGLGGKNAGSSKEALTEREQAMRERKKLLCTSIPAVNIS